LVLGQKPLFFEDFLPIADQIYPKSITPSHPTIKKSTPKNPPNPNNQIRSSKKNLKFIFNVFSCDFHVIILVKCCQIIRNETVRHDSAQSRLFLNQIKSANQGKL
jgi:hypothetical protein